MELLKFYKGNAKLGKTIYTFSLPAGHTCPGADKCLAKVNRDTGKLADGTQTQFRCFSASQEATYKNTRLARWANFDLIRGKDAVEISKVLIQSIPEDAGMVRVHVSGDFFSQEYFNAWMLAAKARPDTVFYAYTKSVKFWVAGKDMVPSNFQLTASMGGQYDELITQNNLKYAQVVFNEADAKNLNLEIDHDDSHAYSGTAPFALLLHGVQPSKSAASVAMSALRKQGKSGYTRKQLPAA